MTDLFNLPETLSPRLAWMQKHGIETYQITTPRCWSATQGEAMACGDTEDEAITNLAKLLKIPLWNEEGFK